MKIRNYSKDSKNFLGLPEDLKLLSRHPSLEGFFGKKLKKLFIKKNETKVLTSSHTNTFDNNKPINTVIKPITPKTKEEFDPKIQEDRIVPTLGKKEIKNNKNRYLTKIKNEKTFQHRYLDELSKGQITNQVLNEDEFQNLKNFHLKIKEKNNTNNSGKLQTPLQLKPKRNSSIGKMMQVEKVRFLLFLNHKPILLNHYLSGFRTPNLCLIKFR